MKILTVIPSHINSFAGAVMVQVVTKRKEGKIMMDIVDMVLAPVASIATAISSVIWGPKRKEALYANHTTRDVIELDSVTLQYEITWQPNARPYWNEKRKPKDRVRRHFKGVAERLQEKDGVPFWVQVEFRMTEQLLCDEGVDVIGLDAVVVRRNSKFDEKTEVNLGGDGTCSFKVFIRGALAKEEVLSTRRAKYSGPWW